MTTYTNVSIHRQFPDVVTINNKTIPVVVTIRVEEDGYHEALEDDREIVRRLQTGEIFIGSLIVEAYGVGEVGSDSIGGCYMHSNNAYNSDPFENDVSQLVEGYNLVENALESLKQQIEEKIELLKPYITKGK